MAKTWRRYAFLSVGALLSVGFLYLSMRHVRVDDTLTEIARVPLIAIFLDPLCRLAAMALAAIRSRLMFGGLHRFRFRTLYESVWLAFALNNSVPLRAGDLARVGFLARYGELPASSCLAVVAAERILDLLVLVIIVAATVPFLAGDLPLGSSFYFIAGLVVLSAATGVAISRRPDLFQRVCSALVRPLGKSVRAFVAQKSETFARGLSALGSASAVLGVMGATFLFWGLSMAAIEVWIWAFDLQVPWFAPGVVLGFLAFGLAIPSTPGHVGTFHFFASSAVVFLGVADTQAVSFALVYHAVAVIPLTVLGLPLLFREYSRLQQRPDERPQRDETGADPDSTSSDRRDAAG